MDTYTDLNSNFINGNWKKGSGSDDVEVLNPYSGESIFSFTTANEEDIDEAYSSAVKAQKEWEKTTPSQRRNIFDKAAQIMKERKDEITGWITKESGGTVAKAETEWMIAFEALRVAASYPYEMKGEIFPSLIPGKESRMYRKPVGVITVISPWNFLLNLSLRSIAPALATGNAVVVKPAEDTPVTGATILAKVFEEAGLPDGLFNVVLGKGSEIGDYLVEHPSSALVSFTGSTPVGKRIAKKAAEQLKEVSLELGGNNVIIVLDDADIDRAVDAALFGKFMHQGQICMAVNRILVDERIEDEFTKKFVERTNELTLGDPSDPETDLGPIINSDQVKKINELVDESLEAGAELLTERKVNGNLMSPLVFKNVTNDMPIAAKEVFGPVAPIITFNGEDEAIKIANDTQYGLSGAVHSKDTERALRVAKNIETGMVHINDQSVNDDANAVFGGEKDSGIGRFNGDFVKEEFTTTQWITVQHEEREYAF